MLIALAAALMAAGAGGPAGAKGAAAPGGSGVAVEPRFELGAKDASPFPSDQLTVADPAQRTGLRIALGLPGCRAVPSTCEDVRLLNELDGFDLKPRLAIRFSGAIELASVSPRSVLSSASGPDRRRPCRSAGWSGTRPPTRSTRVPTRCSSRRRATP